MTDTIEQLHRLWEDAAMTALENSRRASGTAQQKNTAEKGGEVKLQAREYDANGNAYWQIESNKDIFKNIKSAKKLKEVAYNYILKGDKGNKVVGLIDGHNLEFVRISANEYVYGKQSQGLSGKTYKQKMRMSPSITDLIENADIKYDAPDHKNHKLFPNGFKNYQGRVGIDNTIFRYIVRVGKAKNGMIFYDINLEVDVEVPSAKSTSLLKKSTSNDSISKSAQKVKDNVKKSERDVKYSLRDYSYENRNASDYYSDSIIYTYDFLVSQKDMKTVALPATGTLSNAKGKIDDAKVLSEGKKNILSVGIERNGKTYVKNLYTNRELRIDNSTIKHGLSGTYNRHLTNARIASVIGSVVQNAIPINALKNTSAKAEGTYAMVAYCRDNQNREFIAVVTVEQHTNNIDSFELYDVAHAVSGRQKTVARLTQSHREFTLSRLPLSV